MFLSHRAFQQQLVGLLLMVCASVLHANTEAGKILYSRGVVSVVDAQDSARGGKTGATVFEGDKVVTGRGALAQIRLSDGALIALRGDSQYLIEKQSFGEDEGLYEQAGKLFTGWMRSVTGTIGHKYPQKVSQSTSVATIGIRGTVYQIIHIPPEGLPGFAGEEPGTYVMLEEGAVEMTGEGGTRLLKPGDVVFIPAAGGAPQLVPEQFRLFENAEDGVINTLETEENIDFSRQLNDGLTSTVVGGASFDKYGYAGYVDGSQYSSTGFNMTVTDTAVMGSGANRRLVSLTDETEGVQTYRAFAGATPMDTGHHVLANGSEINWGTWDSADYYIDYGSSTGSAANNWEYMIGSNFIDLQSVSGLNGTATYNYVGGSALTDNSGNTIANVLPSSAISFNFANTGAEVTGLSIVTDNIGTFGCTSVCGLADLQSGFLSIDDGAGVYTGSLGGTFVGNAAGLMTNIDLFNGATGTVQGTAAFETDTPPTYIPPLQEVGL